MAALLQSTRVRTLQRAFCHTYYSYSHPPSSGHFSPTEKAILSAALSHVPSHGFTQTSLALGARDTGYLDVSTNLFPQGAFSLVHYHLVVQRLNLATSPTLQSCEKEQPLGVGSKVKALTWERLIQNAKIIHKWQEALALMALPNNTSLSLHELACLSDEIWFLAGDTSVDTSWYTKRASLSTIYAAADVFMTNDTSKGFTDTQEFLDRRFDDMSQVGTAIGDLGQWFGFTTRAGINILRSKGVMI